MACLTVMTLPVEANVTTPLLTRTLKPNQSLSTSIGPASINARNKKNLVLICSFL